MKNMHSLCDVLLFATIGCYVLEITTSTDNFPKSRNTRDSTTKLKAQELSDHGSLRNKSSSKGKSLVRKHSFSDEDSTKISTTQPIPSTFRDVKPTKLNHSVNMDAAFLKELDELDDYMVNVSKFDYMCGPVKHLKYCSNISYYVTKDLSRAPYFQEKMAQAAVDTLSILTKGETTSCEKILQQLFCAQKFPACNEFQATMEWKPVTNCKSLIGGCSPKARDLLNQMKICEKLSSGATRIFQCVPYMPPAKADLCEGRNVSAWLYHAGIEINSLLRFQFSLNENLSADCKRNVTDYMCDFGLRCHLNEPAQQYTDRLHTKCQQTITACEGQSLSKAIKDLFLQCNMFTTQQKIVV